MDGERHWHEDLALPALLGEARKAYGWEIKRDLVEAGFDDVPQLGPRVLGGIARNGGQVGDIARAFGVSRQAASKLIDTLVVRGYIERRPVGSDRRRVDLALTDQGEAAAAVVAAAVARVDAAVAERIGEEELARMRGALGAIVELAEA
jgi:DNA-binding MarR family transcriptional regulator